MKTTAKSKAGTASTSATQWPSRSSSEIFQTGFPDLNLQMWAAYTAERTGELNGRFGCATPDEAVASHELFAAALKSHEEKAVEEL